MNKDERDKISVAAKKPAADSIKRYYLSFGWELAEECEDDKYEDTVILTFYRPHFINNRDDLQLLQVKLENKLNRLGYYELKKNERATVFGLAFGLFGGVIVAGGIYLIAFVAAFWAYICGGILRAAGCAMFALCGICARKMYNADKVKYDG